MIKPNNKIHLTFLTSDESSDEPELLLLKVEETKVLPQPMNFPAEINWKKMSERADLGLRSNLTAWQEIKRGIYRLWKGI